MSGHDRRALGTMLVAGGAGVVLSWEVDHRVLVGSRWAFVWLIFAWVPLWLAASWAATRLPRRVSLGSTMVLSLLTGIAAVCRAVPSISSDVYRYAWDGHVQLSGIDPYRYAPDAPQLRSLRGGFFPTSRGCAAIGQLPGCSLINHVHDRTIYPAVAEAWFAAVHLLTPGDVGSRPWQVAGVVLDVLIVRTLISVLRQRHRDPRLVTWYALCPLPAVEFAANGHVDAVALLFILLGLVALHRGLRVAAGVLVGLAIMVKLYPVFVLAAGWRRGRWRFVLAAAAVCVLTEAPHVAAVGLKVIGYLPGYLQQEKYSSGQRFLLLGLLGLPSVVTILLAVVAVVAVTAYVLRSDLDPATGSAVVLIGLMLVTTSAQPWYAVAIGGIAVAAGRPWALAVPLAAEPYYAATQFGSPHQIAIGRIGFAAAAVVTIAGWSWQRRREQQAPVLRHLHRPDAELVSS